MKVLELLRKRVAMSQTHYCFALEHSKKTCFFRDGWGFCTAKGREYCMSLGQLMKGEDDADYSLARERAAQAWCTHKTSKKEMDVDLAEAFADILNDVWSKPWLGNATTGELIDELRARCEINGTLGYKTVGEGEG